MQMVRDVNMEDAILKAIAGDDYNLKKALRALGVKRRERDAFLLILKETEFKEGVGTAVEGLLAEMEALADAKMEVEEEHAMEGLRAAEERAMRDRRDAYSVQEDDIGDEDLAEEEDTYNEEEEEDIGDEDLAEGEALQEEENEEALKTFDRKLKTGAFLDISSDSD